MDDGTVAVVPMLPPCDFCKQNDRGKTPEAELPRAEFDARLIVGTSWAWMCGVHHGLYGVKQLGTGYGQRLVTEASERAAAMARHPAGKGR